MHGGSVQSSLIIRCIHVVSCLSAGQQSLTIAVTSKGMLLQAVCQFVMNGDSDFEEALLKLDGSDQHHADEAKARISLDMFCLDCTGRLTLLTCHGHPSSTT